VTSVGLNHAIARSQNRHSVRSRSGVSQGQVHTRRFEQTHATDSVVLHTQPQAVGSAPACVSRPSSFAIELAHGLQVIGECVGAVGSDWKLAEWKQW
jgi:hypothetical protein